MSQDAPPTDVDRVTLRVRKALAPLMASDESWQVSLNGSKRSKLGKRSVHIKIMTFATVEIDGDGDAA